MRGAQMYEVVEVGPRRLIGELIRAVDDVGTVQVYENTSGLRPGQPVYPTGRLLSVNLGPGLMGNIYDGIQRPLREIAESAGAFIPRGEKLPALNTSRQWRFTPSVKEGEKVQAGQIIGTLPETPLIEHRVLVPPDCSGTVRKIVAPGDYTVEQEICVVQTPAGDRSLKLAQEWASRMTRPYREREMVTTPLISGLRVIDMFFPIAKGGTAMIPGGFGTGKTMTQHSLAKWCDADIIIYIGCGERGNEMTDVLTSFPELVDPKSGHPLMERTVLIANTSNMPVAAREVSIYTGITLAEYYRDMGYAVGVMADSTSRWAEALRELSGRLEEMPAEEGYPAYLADAPGPVLRARRLRRHARRTPRVRHDHRRGLADGRRFLRAGHPAHAPLRPVLLGAGHRPGLLAALPGDPLAQELQRIRGRRGGVVGRRGPRLARPARQSH